VPGTGFDGEWSTGQRRSVRLADGLGSSVVVVAASLFSVPLKNSTEGLNCYIIGHFSDALN